MTNRIEGAWNQCAKCGARIRRDNRSGYCPSHRYLSPTVREQQESSRRSRSRADGRGLSAADRARKLMGLAWAAAAGAGHSMSMMMKDVTDEDGTEDGTAFISECLTCGRYLAVDLAESAEAYGDVVDQACGPRRPPAETRSEFMSESASATAALEREALTKWMTLYIRDTPCTREALDRAGW